MPEAAMTKDGTPLSTPRPTFWRRITDGTTTAGETADSMNLRWKTTAGFPFDVDLAYLCKKKENVWVLQQASTKLPSSHWRQR